MNPFKYAQMMKYLTRAKKANPELPNVFPASKAPIPAKTQTVEEMEAINRFVRGNPRTKKAGGGMLVQPGFGGVRQGYAVSKTDNNKYNPFYKNTTNPTNSCKKTKQGYSSCYKPARTSKKTIPCSKT